MSGLLPLNIFVTHPVSGERTQYALHVPLNSSVAEVGRMVRQAAGFDRMFAAAAASKQDSPAEYGLFRHSPPAENREHWLKDDAPIDIYHVTAEDVLEYRKRWGTLKVRLLDHTVKTYKLDLSKPIKELMPYICSKIGITNNQEYDLTKQTTNVSENPEDQGRKFSFDPTHLNYATIERHLKARDQRKMVKLKEKLATDDENTWLDHGLTFIDQGIGEGDIVLLKRRYFYSDQTVDVKDAVEHNLLFVQCRDAIVNGTHPITLAEAIVFASLQAQAEYGDFNDSKRAVDIRPMLPKAYVNPKKVDKKTLADYQKQAQDKWKEHQNLNELDAKNKYIKMARSLKTYGVTFFLVKEKMKGKNKMVPRLFGVSRNAVMRLDERSKEILDTWPMTWIKRWAVTSNTFSLDFGDYSDGRYSMQTQDGKTIAQLIAGYIDLIRQRTKPDDYAGKNAKISEIGEENVDPQQNIKLVTNQSNVSLAQKAYTGNLATPGILGDTKIAEHKINYLAGAQAKIANLVKSFAAVVRTSVGENGQQLPMASISAMDAYEEKFAERMGQVAASVGQLVYLAADPAKSAVAGEKVLSLIDELEDLADSLKKMSANYKNTPQGSNLLTSAEGFCQSFSDLLDAVANCEKEGKGQPEAGKRQALLAAASKTAEKGKHLTAAVEDLDGRPHLLRSISTEKDAELDEGLTALLQQMSAATADIVRKAKLIAGETSSAANKSRILSAAADIPFRTAEVMVCAKLVRMCPTFHDASAASRHNLKEALDALDRALWGLDKTAHGDLGVAPVSLHYVDELSDGVRSFSQLIGRIQQSLHGMDQTGQKKRTQDVVDNIEKLTGEMTSADCTTDEVMQKGHILVMAAGALIEKLDNERRNVPSGDAVRQQWLDNAINQLKTLNSQLSDNLEDFNRNPTDTTKRQAIFNNAQEMMHLVSSLTSHDRKYKLLRRLSELLRKTAFASSMIGKISNKEKTNKKQSPEAIERLSVTSSKLTEKAQKLCGNVETVLTGTLGSDSLGPLKDNLEALIALEEDTLESGKGVMWNIEDRETGEKLSVSLKDLDELLGKTLDALLELDTYASAKDTEASASNSNLLFLIDQWIRNIDKDIIAIEENDGIIPPPEEFHVGPNDEHYQTPMDLAKQAAAFIKDRLGAEAAEKDLDGLMQLLQDLVKANTVLREATEVSRSDEQAAVLNHLKTILEAANQYITAFKDQSTRAEEGQSLLDSIAEYANLLDSQRSGRMILRETLPVIDETLEDLQEQESHSITQSPSADATALLKNLRSLLKSMSDIVLNVDLRVTTNQQALREFGKKFCGSYKEVCCVWAQLAPSVTHVDETVKKDVHAALVQVGHSCTDVLKKAAMTKVSGREAFPKACRAAAEKINYVLQLLHVLDCGTQSLQRALSTIDEMEEELETSLTFVKLGHVPEADGQDAEQQRPSHQESTNDDLEQEFMRRAQALIGSLKKLGGTNAKQMVLAETVDASTALLTGYVEFIRETTSRKTATNPEAQMILIRAQKMAASAVAELMRCLQKGVGRAEMSPAEQQEYDNELHNAKMHASSCILLLAELTSAVNRGSHLVVLQLLVQSSQNTIKSPVSSNSGKQISDEEVYHNLFTATKEVKLLVDNAELALKFKKPQDILGLVNSYQNSISQITVLSRVAASSGQDINTAISRNADDCGQKVTSYISTVYLFLSGNSGAETGLLEARKAELLHSLNILEKAAAFRSPTGTLRKTSTLTITIDQELSGAAANIERATKRLEEIQNRKTVYIPNIDSATDSDTDDSDAEFEYMEPKAQPGLNEADAQILDFCRMIMRASAALIPAAGSAQSELIRLGLVSERAGRYSQDGQWSQGFISAAKAVGLSCQTLCDAANALLSGQASEEKLISASKQVAGFTAQLLLACKVKGDPNSPTMKQLLAAGVNVKRATDNLVQFLLKKRRGLQAINVAPQEVVVNKKLVGGIAQEIKATEQVSIKRKELEEAQKILLLSRKSKGSPAGTLPRKNAVIDELAAQEAVLIKERELAEAQAYLQTLQEAKYGQAQTSCDEFRGYGYLDSTLPRKSVLR
ncbi:talin-1-like isoform X2 [Paramacrobiotus metropolitanus]|uniref:talin-1-like isoform X2 n=1 Tax=Paramacrobiotus metropolitanus TaxID=2943436 RepID=UPI0024461B7F|nr:talin-1-like isoform X2 [Paramacrobiotus metropolitanus]